MKTITFFQRIFIASLLLVMLSANAFSAAFTKGNLVVTRVGAGTVALANVFTPIFLDEYTPTGTFVQSVPLPTVASGINQPIGLSGNTRMTEGDLNLSSDKRYLLTSGYKTNLAGVPGSSNNSRIIARIDVNGVVNSSTQLNELSSTVRGVASTNGTDLWIGNGPAYTTIGAVTSTATPAQVLSTASFMGALNLGIYDNKLYNCSNVAQNRFGYFDATAPSPGNQTYTTLASYNGAGGTVNNQIVCPNSFVMFDLDPTIPGVDVLYVAEDIYNPGLTTDNTSKGLTKFSKNATGLWVKTGSASCPTTTNGLTGLTGTYNAGTGVTLYAVTESVDATGGTTSTAPTSIVTITDNTGYNGTLSGSLSLVVTSGTNTAFRGIAFAPEGAAYSTNAASNITKTSATLNATVTANGGNTITERGFNYSTTAGVKITDNKNIVAGTTGAYTQNLAGLSLNTKYYAAAYVTNSVGTTQGNEISFYTLAEIPTAPTVNNPTANTLSVTVNVNGNPAATTFAIQEKTTSNYVQADGTLAATAVWQTAATWATKTVTGLAANTSYTFVTKARNGALVETALSAATISSTITTALNNTSNELPLVASNGKIKFTAQAGEKLEVYNTVGQRIINMLTSEGENTIAIPFKGVAMVKVGSRVAKVAM